VTPVHRLGHMRDPAPDREYTSVLFVLRTSTVRELNERCERGGLADMESARDDYVDTSLLQRFEREPAQPQEGHGG
jgi:hypothetical protein